jgi:hypothetical protein
MQGSTLAMEHVHSMKAGAKNLAASRISATSFAVAIPQTAGGTACI